MTSVLVTGAAGFVGAHFVRVAHDAGLRVVALDDLSTSRGWPRLPETIERIQNDVGNAAAIRELIANREIDAVVHFAGRICVGESVRDPALYFEQNLARTLTLLDATTASPLKSSRPLKFILSSSAAVYGQPKHSPITELAATRPISPYGASKLAAEVALAAYGQARDVRWAALRYFNAAGAHPDGSLCEVHDPETHLVPLAIDAALGTRPPLVVHGDDYPTRDGTCIRDYVHVMDLAEAHLAALDALDRDVAVGAVNLGSACGATVREVLTEVATTVGRRVPYSIGLRREGDPPELVAATDRTTEQLGWRSRRDLREIVSDAFRSRRTIGHYT
jgi:UDP-glucose-4-epimerase GalE